VRSDYMRGCSTQPWPSPRRERISYPCASLERDADCS
jgi:hypothetical protein